MNVLVIPWFPFGRYLWIYWKIAKLFKTYHCMVILYQWINFNRYALVSGFLLFFFTFLCFNAIKIFVNNPDGRVSRVWSKKEKEIWQTNRFKCNDRFQRSRWGCRSMKSSRIFLNRLWYMIFSGTFWWTLVEALYILPANILDYRWNQMSNNSPQRFHIHDLLLFCQQWKGCYMHWQL